MQIAIIENLQREELNPVEEACGYAELIDKYGMTQEKVAQMVGRSRSTVANSVRMLALPKRVLKMVEEGTLSAGHAKALLGFDDEEMLIAVANRASEGELTVRQIERLAQKAADAKNSRKESKPKKEDTIYKEVEISLQQALGRRIEVHHGRKKGTLVIEFYDMDDLKALADGIYNMNN
jgi:ParB family chromosome partitioning protein